MAYTALPGPNITFGQALSAQSSIPADYNPQAGPNLSYAGDALLDPRQFYTYAPGGAVTSKVYGWWGVGHSPVLDIVPTTISTNTVAILQALSTQGGTLTLRTSNTTNITVNQSVVAPETGHTVTGLLAIDGASTSVTFGSDATTNIWNPATILGRAVSINTVGSSVNIDDSSGAFVVTGRDIYGYVMTENIAGSTQSSSTGFTYNGQKAFKYISSITFSGGFASSAVAIGVSDVFGLPLYATNGAYVRAYMGNSLVLSSTNITAGATATATSTTGDVRGTMTSSLASNSTRRLVVFQTPNVAALGSNVRTGLAGVSQA